MGYKKREDVSGGVAMRVIICAVSLAALGFVIFTLLTTFKTNKEDAHRKAVSLSEYGLQKAFEKIAESRDWDIDFSDDEDGGRFNVAFTREQRGDTLFLTIASTGVSGSTSQTEKRVFRLQVSEEGDSVWVNEDIR